MTVTSRIYEDHPVVKTIICSGSSYEIGLQHGSAAASEIHANIKTYTAFFQETAGLMWTQAKDRAIVQFVPTLDRLYPEILEEMAGIAEGAGGGVTRDDILTLNIRSEIALTNYSDGCTSLSQCDAMAQKKINDEGKTQEVWLAQNWDWMEELQHGMVILDIRPRGRDVRLKFLGEGGIVGKIGMNSHRFGLCMNALRSGSFDNGNLPVHVMSRRLLEYATCVDDALAIVEKFGLASTTNYVFADSSGKNLDVECSPKGNMLILADDGFVAHTNHLYSQKLPRGLADHPASNSFDRLERIRELTKLDQQQGNPTTFGTIRQRLSDEQGTPFSICRDRPVGAVGMERMTTLASIIMELGSGTAEVLIGRPCEHLPVVGWSL